MKTVILAGGKGIMNGTLTANTTKPLCNVAEMSVV